MNRGVPESKIDVIYNWSDELSMRPGGEAPVQASRPGAFTVLFAGTMGLAQDLDAVLNAAQICASSAPNARFALIGGGVARPALEKRAVSLGLPNVTFFPRQPLEKMGSILASADALLVHLKDDPLFRITIPSKTQAYMAAGKPIIMGVKGDAADLVDRSGAGVLCEPGNPGSIAGAVGRLARLSPEQLTQMGSAGRAYYDRELSLAVGVTNFERVFEKAYRRCA
jgi:glycosyltransferase involved in cell wall biosynthesis